MNNDGLALQQNASRGIETTVLAASRRNMETCRGLRSFFGPFVTNSPPRGSRQGD